VSDDQDRDARLEAIPDSHGHAKGEHKPFAEERPIPYTARMLFLWFYHACRRGGPRFMMVADHINYLTFEDPAAVNLVRRALKLAHAGDLYGAAETAGIDVQHAAVVSEGLRRGMRYSIGAEVDNDPRNRPDAQNIVDAMRPDAIVRSIHFLGIDHPELGAGFQWPFDNPEFKHLYDELGTAKVWELYMAALLDAIEKLPAHIVGHFYVPAKFGHWPDDETLERYEDEFVDACAARGLAIEVNSRIFYRTYVPEEQAADQRQRYFDVHLRLLRKAKAKGVGIAVGSDAHSPRDQGAGFDAVLQMLDAAEINEIAFPVNGRMARVALRATEELLRPPQPEPVAAPPPAAETPVDEEEDDEAAADGHAADAHGAEPATDDAVPAVAASSGGAGEAEAAPKPKRVRKPRPSRARKPAAEVAATEAAVETAPAETGSVEIEAESVSEAFVVEAVAVVEPGAEAGPGVVGAVEERAVAAAVSPEAPAKPPRVRAKPAKREAQPTPPEPPAAEAAPVMTDAAPKRAEKAKPAPARQEKTSQPKAAAAKSAPKSAPKPAPKSAATAKASPKAEPKRAAAPAKKSKKAAAKPPARKAASKKGAARPAPARKPAAKPPARRPAAKKAAAAKRAAPKTGGKRSAPAKRAPAKRAPAKKAATKATAKKKTSKSRR
jgi:HisJ family histidinol phosphate phosphatase